MKELGELTGVLRPNISVDWLATTNEYVLMTLADTKWDT